MAQLSNAIYTWDFTLPVSSGKTHEELILWMKENCKKWAFQLEKSSTGYDHFQGRISLKKKLRKIYGTIDKSAHWSPTSNECNSGPNFYDYVTKQDTRIEGPWTDKDTEKQEDYIPEFFKTITLLPFQKQILEQAEIRDDRSINMIIDSRGNLGKSKLADYAELFHDAIDLPVVNDAEKLLATMCNRCMATGVRKTGPVFIDLPRAMSKRDLSGIMSAAELIKKGKLYDLRHKYKEWRIEPPSVWIFSNAQPELSKLSRDRWKFWKIEGDTPEQRVLVPINTPYQDAIEHATKSAAKKEAAHERKLHDDDIKAKIIRTFPLHLTLPTFTDIGPSSPLSSPIVFFPTSPLSPISLSPTPTITKPSTPQLPSPPSQITYDVLKHLFPHL